MEHLDVGGTERFDLDRCHHPGDAALQPGHDDRSGDDDATQCPMVGIVCLEPLDTLHLVLVRADMRGTGGDQPISDRCRNVGTDFVHNAYTTRIHHANDGARLSAGRTEVRCSPVSDGQFCTHTEVIRTW